MPQELTTDIFICGGGTGGVAAAMAVARSGHRCVVAEPTQWLGGQLTSQAVPPDEHRWIEGLDGFHGATGSYVTFRRRVREWYRQHRNLKAEAAANETLNPGNGWVSRLCFEPTVGEAVLRDMLGGHLGNTVQCLFGVEPVAADVEKSIVRSVTLRDADGGETTVHARYFLDASELGDLLPLTRTPFVVGAEAASTYAEMHAPAEANWRDQQGPTWCFAIENRPGEDHTIDKPAGYAEVATWKPQLTPPWPGPLFSWQIDDAENPRTLPLVPWPDEPPAGELELWRYRRIVDRSIYADPSTAPPDVCLWNTVQPDYFRRPILLEDGSVDRSALDAAKEHARSFLYWIQTAAPRHDGGVGYPGLKLRGNELGTSDGFAMAPYIRESRRLLARRMVTEADVGFDQRRADGRPMPDDAPLGMAEPFADSVGLGHYMIDLHPTPAGRNSVYVAACPFRISLNSLLPASGPTNLIAAGKCLGVSHVANGCYRLHPVEWGIGEAAGALAAWCLARNVEPAVVGETPARRRDFQQELVAQHVELAWPWERGENLDL